jgi:hypothetical protein
MDDLYHSRLLVTARRRAQVPFVDKGLPGPRVSPRRPDDTRGISTIERPAGLRDLASYPGPGQYRRVDRATDYARVRAPRVRHRAPDPFHARPPARLARPHRGTTRRA